MSSARGGAHDVTRREMLRRLARGGVGLTLGAALLGGCGDGTEETAQRSPGAPKREMAGMGEDLDLDDPGFRVNLRLSYWLESGIIGLERFVNESAVVYRRTHLDTTVKPQRQPPEEAMRLFEDSARLVMGPDLQALPGGTWLLEQAWRSRLLPFDRYWTPEDLRSAWPEVRHYTAWGGAVYGVPFYQMGMAGIYNRRLFARAGLDPENPPRTWDDWLKAASLMKAIGIPLMALGDRNATAGGDLFSWIAIQTHDDLRDIARPVLGEAKYTDPPYAEYWFRLAELVARGAFNPDVASITDHLGHSLFFSGQAASTWTNHAEIERLAAGMGKDVVGVMPFPVFGKGRLAGTVSGPVQVLCIPAFARHPIEAAEFARWLRQPDQLTSAHRNAGLIVPVDPFDMAIAKAGPAGTVLGWLRDRPGPWYHHLYPSRLETEVIAPTTWQMWLKEVTPEKAAAKMEKFIVRWRDENPTQVEAYRKWMGL